MTDNWKTIRLTVPLVARIDELRKLSARRALASKGTKTNRDGVVEEAISLLEREWATSPETAEEPQKKRKKQ